MYLLFLCRYLEIANSVTGYSGSDVIIKGDYVPLQQQGFLECGNSWKRVLFACYWTNTTSRSGSCIPDFCLFSWIDNFINWAWQIYIPYFACPQSNKPRENYLYWPSWAYCLLSCGTAASMLTKLSYAAFLWQHFLNDSIPLLLEGRALVKSFK